MEITSRSAALLALALMSVLIGAVTVPNFLHDTGNNMSATTTVLDENIHEINRAVKGKAFPVITAENQRIRLNQSYDAKSWVTVRDAHDGNITNKVEVYGTINNAKKGDYEIRYSVRNSYGLKSEKKIRIIVD